MKEELEIGKIGLVSSESVLKHTGRNWNQWVAILRREKADLWTHREITELLKNKFRLSPWWQQSVAIGFGVHIGKRVLGRNSKGEFSTVSSKTLNLKAPKAWRYLLSPAGISIWLRPVSRFQLKARHQFEAEGGIFGEVRTFQEGKRIRITWQDATWSKPSVVNINLIPRAGEKCMLALQHEKLPSAAARLKWRHYWKEALSRPQSEV